MEIILNKTGLVNTNKSSSGTRYIKIIKSDESSYTLICMAFLILPYSKLRFEFEDLNSIVKFLNEKSIIVTGWLSTDETLILEKEEKIKNKHLLDSIASIKLDEYLVTNNPNFPYIYIDTVSMKDHAYLYYCNEEEFKNKKFGYDDWYEFPIYAIETVLTLVNQ